MNRQTDWDSIISEYKLEMCKRAVGIIGKETQQNVKKIEGQGLEDISYNVFNLNAPNIGTGVGMLVILFLLFKIIKHSNVQSGAAIVRCLFPCCRLSHRTSNWDHHNDTDNNNPYQLNVSNHRINGRLSTSPMYRCKTVRGPSRTAESGRQYLSGQTTTHSSQRGLLGPLTMLENASKHTSSKQPVSNGSTR